MTDSVQVSGSAIPENTPVQLSVGDRLHVPIYAEYMEGNTRLSLLQHLEINKQDEEQQYSSQGVLIGRQPRPYNFDNILNFKTSNVHHSTCINTKVSSTVGQGFLTDTDKKRRATLEGINLDQRQQNPTTIPFSTGISTASKLLDPLCTNTFQQILTNVAEDFYQLGNGYMEIVRGGPNGEITGIHHIPARDVWVYVENQQYDYHYEIVSNGGPLLNRRFSRFGDKVGFMQRMKGALPVISAPGPDGQMIVDPRGVSEVIHFKNHNTLSRWYGFADWLSAVPSVDLAQCVMQQKYDFYLNRGVPEFMLFVLGATVPPKPWKEITTAISANIGKGNSHKSLAVNLPSETKIDLQKLMTEGKGDENFQTTRESLAMDVVTAHRTPPLLAGIQIPGKLGANNELPNALMAFQTLVIGPAQYTFQSTLGDTLGNSLDNGGLALKFDDFAFKTILDSIDVGIMSTVGAMKQPIAGSGRDPAAGLKD